MKRLGRSLAPSAKPDFKPPRTESTRAALHWSQTHACAFALPISIAATTVAALFLRLPTIDRFPFREDEAIYAYWALHGLHVDPWFLHVWPDKPPLFLWLLMATFHFLGEGETSARSLNIAVSVLTVPVVGAAAHRLWGRLAGATAAAALAFSPLAIAFAPTAFTDPLLVLTGVLAVYCAIARKPLAAGVALGAAIVTKQQGLLYVPLIVALLCLPHERQRLLHLIGGIAIVLLPVLWWDSQRWAVAPSPWDLSARNYGGIVLLSPAEWGARTVEWSPWVGYLLGSAWPLWIVGIVAAAGNGTRIKRMRWSKANFSTRFHALKLPNLRFALRSPTVLIMFWAAGFLALHVVTNVQAWDRYLLPLAPALALLGGWAAARLAQQQSRTMGVVFAAVLLLALSPMALRAADGRLPVGGDHGDYAGLRESIAEIEAIARDESVVLYHSQLGWHYRFYLFDAIARGACELRWFASPVHLADNARKLRPSSRADTESTGWESDGRALLITPAWLPRPNFAFHLRQRGVVLRERSRHGTMTLYELEIGERDVDE